MRARLARLPYFLSRVGVVVRLWLGGGLTTRQVVRLAMRVSRFERWGVRPITQARFTALIAAADAPPRTAPADMRLRLDMVAARLRQVEAECEAAVRAAAEAREALEDTRNLAGRSDARALQMLHRLEAATLRMQHLERVAAAYDRIADREGPAA